VKKEKVNLKRSKLATAVKKEKVNLKRSKLATAVQEEKREKWKEAVDES